MEIYSTEEQQEEAIKRFFRENGTMLIAGVVLGFSGLYGWKEYNQTKIESAETASDAYTQLLETAGQDNSEVLEKAAPFLTEYKDSNYAVLAAFVAAKEAVDANNFTAAKEKLNWVLEHASNAELKAIATTRIARIEFSEGNLDTALTMLSADFPAGFTAQVEELKGDIYLVKEDKDNARLAYQAAVDASDNTNPVLQVKLDNLAVADLL
jgi:predicted negative regulator of RcsB-dependent stress response